MCVCVCVCVCVSVGAYAGGVRFSNSNRIIPSGQPFMLRRPGAVGVWGPAQEHLVVVLKVERELYIYSPPPIIPTGPRLELATFRLRVRLSTIRPRLPQVVKFNEVHDNQGYFVSTTSLWESTKRAAYLSINSSPSEVRLELHTPHCDTFALELAAVHVSARDSCF